MADVTQLAPALWQIVLPLPIPRLPSVNCFVFAGDEGLTLIDPGGGHEDGHSALLVGLKELGFAPADVHRAIATHLHPDHMGLATRLVEETGCSYTMHRSAASRMDAYNDWDPLRRRVSDLAALHGAGTDEAGVLRGGEERPDWAPTSMPPTDLVDDDDEITIAGNRHLSVVHTPGHDGSHICLIDSATGALFTGDHVLPRITPFVPYPEDEPDNLGTYLASLRRVEQIDPPVAYPAHSTTIERAAARARQISLHHHRRLDGMLAELRRGPATAWQVMQNAFKPNMPPVHTRLAFQETLAHLEYLRFRRRIARYEEDGTLVYRRA